MNKYLKRLIAFIIALAVLGVIYFLLVRFAIINELSDSVITGILFTLAIVLVSFSKPKAQRERERNAKQYWDR